MSRHIVSSRDFNQRPGSAKKSTAEGPVFITDQGKPTHVLLTFDDYQRLAGGHSLLEALAMDEGEIEFEPARHEGRFHVPADFSADVSP